VRAYDPAAGAAARRLYAAEPRVAIADGAHAALEGCDALAIVTEWREFRSPDFDVLRAKLAHPVIFDGRNLYDPAVVKAHGFEYHPIGRRT
jgi:UDPglucose 6-dehydrogenase